jgi:hypothetical protein
MAPRPSWRFLVSHLEKLQGFVLADLLEVNLLSLVGVYCDVYITCIESIVNQNH